MTAEKNQNEKQYMVLGDYGNPIPREGDEVNPYIFRLLIDACVFAEEQKKNYDGVTVVEIKILEHQGSGM